MHPLSRLPLYWHHQAGLYCLLNRLVPMYCLILMYCLVLMYRLTLQRHVVKRGESLGSIAKKYGVSTEELAKVNRIGNVNKITVGMELVVPLTGKAAAEVGAPTEAKTEAKAEPTGDSKSEAKTSKSAPTTVTRTVPEIGRAHV